MAGGFDQLLKLVQDGQAVAAGTVNAPIAGIDQNVRYLWELIKAAATGSTIFARQVTVEADANVGEPVFWNANTSRFERAVASIANSTSGVLEVSESTRVWGVVFKKVNATLADLLLYGYAALDVEAALEDGEELAAGTYYLSRTTPGRMTNIRPPIAVPVLRTTGDGKVFVAPQWDDLVYASKPLVFRLKAVPAGEHVGIGSGSHEITNPNAAVEGWLPADHESFDGHAPDGAKFGYNIAVNAQLARAWPPLPPTAAVLYRDGAMVAQEYSDGDGGLVRFDRYGIWWMTDCYGSVPFPDDIDTEYDAVSESADYSESGDPCPHVTPMRLVLSFSQFAFLSEQTVVTSVTSADDRVIIECLGTSDVASVGPLQIRLELTFLSDDVDPGGHLAIKSWDPVANKFHRGPVTTGVYAVSNNVRLTSDAQTEVALDEEDEDTLTTVHHGRVGIDVDTGGDREISVSLVRLGGVLEQYYADVMYLGFPLDPTTDQSELTELRGRIVVPDTLDVVSPVMRLKFRLLGRGVGTTPDLTVTIRRIPKAAAVAALPLTDSALVFDTSVAIGVANQYVDVTSAAFAIAAGDDVLFTVRRDAGDDYNYEVGLMRMVGLISAA